jgi:hypothetical protein
MLTARTGGRSASTFAFASVTLAVTSAADVRLTARRWAVMAIHHGGSTGVVLRFALTGIVVSCQRGRRARQHQKQTGQQDESVDG